LRTIHSPPFSWIQTITANYTAHHFLIDMWGHIFM